MAPKNIADIYKLSPVQQGMLFYTLYAPEAAAYFDQFVVPFRGVEEEAFRAAWRQLVDRHPVLRTSFLWEDLEDPVQVVHRRVTVPIEVEDWSQLDTQAQRARLRALRQEDRRRGFDLTRPPLMRLVLVRTSEEDYWVVWSYHHILLDGWSVRLVLNELEALYQAALRGGKAPLKPVRPFRDYIQWLRRQDLSQAEAYWRRVLRGFESPTPLGIDKAPRSDAVGGLATASFALSRSATAALQSFTRRQRLTLATVFQGCWATVLADYSGRDEVVFGVTVSGRPAALTGVDAMVGCFINTLPVRVRVPPRKEIAAWLRELQASLVAQRRFEYTPLVEIRRWSDIASDQPLFESIVVLEGFVKRQELGGDLGGYQRTDYPLVVKAFPEAENLTLAINYDDARFDATAVRRMLRALATQLLALAAGESGMTVACLRTLHPVERHCQVYEWNDSRALPAGGSEHLAALFEAQAGARPTAPALEFDDRCWDYRELDARANQLAHELRRLGVGNRETLVGLFLERSPEMVTAILGVLKAGGAYVPLDPVYPPQRIAYVLADTGLSVVLTQERLLDKLPAGAAARTLCLDTGWPELAAAPTAAPPRDISAGRLAYVIYTSGSTGKPKGVAVTHANVVRLLRQTEPWYGFGPSDVWTLFHSYAFDFSVWELWGALAYGGRLVVVPYWVSRSPEAFWELLVRRGVTVLNQTPSAFRQLIRAAESAADTAHALRWVVFGGEALELKSLAPWFTRFGDGHAGRGPRLVNMYGITETTVHVTYRPIRAAEVDTTPGSVIGRQIPDLEIHLHDSGFRAVAIGVPGEIHVGGAGLARGYLERAALTAERFLPDPWSGRPGARLYKTGDLARRLGDGDLEYLGRIDQQVKIRGFRIELGEIEAALAAHPAVGEAAVLAWRAESREDVPGDVRLVAYLTPHGEAPDGAELRAHLETSLPTYMVPAAFVVLDILPLTANGKLDRKALPAPTWSGDEERFVAPRNEVEEGLAAIWGDILGLERPGVHDNFFELGGHSLLATRVTSRLRDAWGVELELRQLFEAPTIAALAAAIESARSGEAGGLPPVERVPRDGELPASFAQERLWFFDQFQPGSATYNIPVAVRFAGRLEVAALAAGLAEVTRRHETLRTGFANAGGRPVQVIAPRVELALPIIDLTALPPTARDGESVRLRDAEGRQSFDLTRPPLLRTTLLRRAPQDHVLVAVMHHIVSDGWSMGVLIDEVTALYRAAVAAAGRLVVSPLAELAVQYADVAHWQRQWLGGDELERQLDYWRRQLAGVAVLELPTDRPRPAVRKEHGEALAVSLPPTLSRDLEAFSQRQGATLFMALLAGFAALLGRYSGQRDIAVGSPIANRHRTELEGLIGFFVNTLVLRADLGGDPDFFELLARVRETTLAAYASQDVPFEKLVGELAGERHLGTTPLFQVMLVLQNAPVEGQPLPGLELEAVPMATGTAKFDFNLMLGETPAGLAGGLEYDRELFDRATVERLWSHFRNLLGGVLAAPGAPFSAAPLLAAAERQQLCREWNDRRRRRPPAVEDLASRFEAQAAARPDAPALVFERSGEAGEVWSYRELDGRANRLAHELRRLGVGAIGRPESLVGLFLERSPEMVVAILGVLKAGGAYVPLDPVYPAERIAFVLEDTALPVLLTQEGLRRKLPPTSARVISLDSGGEEPGSAPAAAPRRFVGAEQPAYVIYTSGSTGKPKGVVVSHRNVTRLLDETAPWYRFGPADVWTLFHSYAFDFSVWELWGALAYGGQLVLVPYWVSRSPEDFWQLLIRRRVTVLNQTPSAFHQLIPAATSSAEPRHRLRRVVFGGEALELRGLAPWLERFGDQRPRLVNMYGITETTVHVTYRPIALVDLGAASSSVIGRQIPDLDLHVLDRPMQAVPIGVPGEIFVGGDGLARGYLKRPGLTAERFVPDPWSGQTGRRLYRTGDLARLLVGGDLDYLGRIDHQVKIRGFRIELGEIEAALATHEAVREVAVMARREAAAGDVRLVAYLAAAGEAPAASNLRAHLETILPAYMVPSAFVVLDSLPLTAHGKLDRKALPAPTWEPAKAEYVAPRTPLEERLAAIWRDVLGPGLERVSTDDSFFELGGHSLLATQVVSRVRQELGLEISVRTLFESPSLAQLAAAIDAAQRRAAGREPPPITAVPRAADMALSWAQERLWFIDHLDPGNPAYNLAFGVRVRGPLEALRLHRSLLAVARRHETLRCSFPAVDGKPVQRIRDKPDLALPLVDLSALAEPHRSAEVHRLAAAEARQAFDLATGPLLRFALLRLVDTAERQDNVLLVNMHHIVSDGWSMGVLMRDLATAYDAQAAGERAPTLPELPLQYADFAHWQRQWLRDEQLERQLAYWREHLAGVPVLELPTDRPRVPVANQRGSIQRITVPRELTEELHELANRAAATLFMTLLAALSALLARLTGQRDLAAGTPIANRNYREIEGLIGFFVNTLALRTDVGGNPTFGELLARIRDVTFDAYAHQDVPFQKVVEELDPQRSLSTTPFFQVLLALENTPMPRLELPTGLVLEAFEIDLATAKFDLILTLQETSRGLAGWWAFKTDLFDPTTVARISAHYQTLARSAVDDPDRRLSELALLTAAQHQQLAVEYNARDGEAAPALLHELIARQTGRTPQDVALRFEGESLTYAELDASANRLARRLQRLGVGPEVLVGVCLERSFHLVVSLLAILKAGGAYLPLDPKNPRERLEFMVDDAGAAVLVTAGGLATLLPERALPVLDLHRLGPELAGESAAAPVCAARGENPAYVIYTSGSTGRPKGVVVSHRSIAQRLLWDARARLDAKSRFLQKTNISFDVSVAEIFSPLLVGGRVIVARPGGQKDTAYLGRLIADEEITDTSFPPTILALMLGEEGFVSSPHPRRTITGGETVPAELPASFYAAGASGEIVNRYGPTEATISVSEWACRRGVRERSLPIGRPIGNAEILLLDRWHQLVPLGAPGEICLGGPGVARGYLRRPARTAESFVSHPLSRVAGERLYRSGDLGRLRGAGALEFLGRLDQQVKIRGFRVELGEIETVLARHQAVREAAVIDVPDGATRRLVGFVALESELARAGTTLRTFLADSLPEHMVPSALAVIDELPLTATGKVDRRALQELPTAAEAGAEDFEAPRDEIERLVAGVWSDVLGVNHVSVRDDFFALGGQSLLATQVVSRLRRDLGVEVPVRALFESPTLAALAAEVAAAQRREHGTELPPIVLEPRGAGGLPLSFAQQRLWFLDRFESERAVFNMPFAVRLTGRLDAGCLAASLGCLIERHESLRTRFTSSAGAAVQVIEPHAGFTLPLADLSVLPPARREAHLQQLAQEEARRPFDLERGPLFRATLLRLGARGGAPARDQHMVLFNMHHIVSDGWSIGVLIRELAALYRALTAGQPAPLAELPVQYADFSAWQRLWLGETLDRQLAYWREQLAGAPRVLELATDRPRPALQTFRGTVESLRLSGDLHRGLEEFGRLRGASLFMTLLAAYTVLLRRYSGQRDVVVGTPIANRNRVEIEGLIGCFVNTLVLRLGSLAAPGRGEPSFGDVLERAREVTLGAYAHQDLPFEKLVEDLQPERSLSYSPLFQAMLVLQNAPLPAIELPGLTLDLLPAATGTAKYDLTLNVTPSAGGLNALCEYNTDLFDAATVRRMLLHFRTLLEAVVVAPETPLPELPLLSPAERQLLVNGWNDTAAAYPLQCLHHQFEAQVDRTPDATAVLFDDPALRPGTAKPGLTYRELDEAANRLAHHLLALGVGPEHRVAVLMERSLAMVTALMAIVKAGGAYVPLDPSYPEGRLAFMLGDFARGRERAVVLSQAALAERAGRIVAAVGHRGVDVVYVDAERERIAARSAARPAVGVEGLDLDRAAYMIYTSGSTGRPKGTVNSHRGISNRLLWMQQAFGLTAADRVLQKTPFSFDVSVWEFFWPLALGARLVVARPGGHQDAAYLVRLIAEEAVTTLHFVPSMLQLFVEETGVAELGSLERVIASGEALPFDLVQRFYARLGATGAELHNLYGPTEAAVDVTWWSCERRGERRSVPIGKPIANVQTHVLDRHLRPVPLGVAGELHLGGVQLARGYLNRPALTAEKFIPDPFAPPDGDSGQRLYKTGDLTRWLADGEIEYLGRIDHQVKLRGFRIELGEIEAALTAQPQVREAVVVLREDRAGDPRLAAYLVLSDAVPPDGMDAVEAAVRQAVAVELPEYMAPSAFVVLEDMPLNPNGKVDRKALPEPAARAPEADFVAPRDDTEHALAELYEELLGSGPVSVTSDFFALGGHSLLAVRLLADIRGRFGRELPLVTLFQDGTVERLAARLRGAEAETPPSSLVEIQAGADDRLPLHCVHPAGGNVLCYADLARALGPEQPVYGLEARGLRAGEEPRRSIAEMAEAYLQALRAVQPEGPYFLLGWSLGGVVAYEMACRLADEGQEVARLVMLDAFARVPEQELSLSPVERLLTALGGAVTFAEEELRGLDSEQQLRSVLDKARAAGVVSESFGLPEVRRHLEVYEAGIEAYAAYTPPAYGGAVTLFRAREGPRPADETLGWRQHVRGELRTLLVPGAHQTMVYPAHVEALARQLAALLRETRPLGAAQPV